jgi:Tfp pilus assembly protein PilV
MLRRRTDRKGLSLLEAVLASAIIGASFVAFFGLAGQSMASASDARSATICAFLAEGQMNRLLSQRWTRGSNPTTWINTSNDFGEFNDITADPMDAATAEADGSGYLYSTYSLEHPDSVSSGAMPAETTLANKAKVNAGLRTTGAAFGGVSYYVTWDVLKDPWASQLATGAGNNFVWERLRVRCSYHDFRAAGPWRAVTFQTYKFANPL